MYKYYTFHSKVFVTKTGENQKLIIIIFSNGIELDCTEYHKFYISDKKNNKITVDAKDLRKDMNIWKCNFPIINGYEDFKYPYISGYIISKCENNSEYNNEYQDIEVPLNCIIAVKLEWLEGYMDGSGIVIDNELHTISKYKLFLEKVRLMCQTLGLNPSILSFQFSYKLIICSFDLYKKI